MRVVVLTNVDVLNFEATRESSLHKLRSIALEAAASSNTQTVRDLLARISRGESIDNIINTCGTVFCQLTLLEGGLLAAAVHARWPDVDIEEFFTRAYHRSERYAELGGLYRSAPAGAVFPPEVPTNLSATPTCSPAVVPPLQPPQSPTS